MRGNHWTSAPFRDGGHINHQTLLSALEGLAEQLHIPVTYTALATEELPGRGGMCVIYGERRIIIERSLAAREKTQLLASGLAQFDLENVFLLPAVREAIERARSREASFSRVRERRCGL